MKWTLECLDADDRRLAAIRKIVDAPAFLSALIEGNGWQVAYVIKRAENGQRVFEPHEWIMVSGDKIVSTFGGRIGVLTHKDYQGHRVMTDKGMAHLLTPEEREQFVFIQDRDNRNLKTLEETINRDVVAVICKYSEPRIHFKVLPTNIDTPPANG